MVSLSQSIVKKLYLFSVGLFEIFWNAVLNTLMTVSPTLFSDTSWNLLPPRLGEVSPYSPSIGSIHQGGEERSKGEGLDIPARPTPVAVGFWLNGQILCQIRRDKAYLTLKYHDRIP